MNLNDEQKLNGHNQPSGDESDEDIPVIKSDTKVEESHEPVVASASAATAEEENKSTDNNATARRETSNFFFVSLFCPVRGTSPLFFLFSTTYGRTNTESCV